MASNYGRSFGFRRSDESMRSGTEGRQKVPATGTFLQGDFVTFDPAAPGYIKKAAANAPIDPGYSGLLIQENSHLGSVFDGYDIAGLNNVKIQNDRLCAIWTGAGIKVWFRNIAARAAAGGRPAIAARTIVVSAGLAIGDLLAWDGAKYVKTTDAATAVARVTLVATDYVECVLAK